MLSYHFRWEVCTGSGVRLPLRRELAREGIDLLGEVSAFEAGRIPELLEGIEEEGDLITTEADFGGPVLGIVHGSTLSLQG
jgi:hypothetical protein